MKSFFKKIAGDRNLLGKIVFTLLIVAVSRSMLLIPIPGINVKALQAFIASIEGVSFFQKHVWLANLRGGALSNTTIAALGLNPFILSCIMVQIAGALIPTIGLEDRKRITRCTYILTIALSLLQGYYISIFLENPVSFGGGSIVLFHGCGFKLTAMASLTAGVLLMLLLARLVNMHGIGNGVAVLVISAPISRIPALICQLARLCSMCIIDRFQILCLLILFITAICVIVIMSRSVRKLPVRYSGSGHVDWVTLRLSWPGRVPVELSLMILYLPLVLTPVLPSMNRLASYLAKGGFSYTIISAMLTVFFSYFYTTLIFKPKRIVEQMGQYGCALDGVSSSEGMCNLLDSKMSKLIPLTALFLVAISLLPYFISKAFSISYSIVQFVSGAFLLVIIGALYDIKCQIEARFKMQDISAGDDWCVAEIASDEIEAEIKGGFLRSKGIPCVVSPLRFTWGMPIKTSIDQYRLYVTREKCGEAIKVLA